MKNRKAIQAYKLQTFNTKEKSEENSLKDGSKSNSKISAKESAENSSQNSAENRKARVSPDDKTGDKKGRVETPLKEGKETTAGSIYHTDENAAGIVGRKGFLKTGFGHKKAAKLLLLLGKEQAAVVLKHLSQDEIEKVTGEIAKIKRIEKAEAEKILEEFGDISGKIAANPRGGIETAREMLSASLGEEKANKILGKVHPYSGDTPFSFLNDMDYQQIMLLLRKEPVHVMSIVLSHLVPDKASQVLESLPPEVQQQAVKRIARMGQVSPEVLTSVEASLRERIRTQGKVITEDIDGQAVLADILKHMPIQDEDRILDNLNDENSSLAEGLREKLFSLESVLEIPDIQIQELLHKYPDRDIATILKGKSSKIENKILRNVSQRRQEFIRSEREQLGPMRRTEVEKVTKDFMGFIRKQAEQGEITLERDELV